MLNAFVSGEAGRAVFVQGTDVSFADIDDELEIRDAPRSMLQLLLADATDVIALRNTSKEVAITRLLLEWRTDRILRMIEIVLNSEEGPEIRQDAVSALDELCDDDGAVERVLRQTCSLPWPGLLLETELRAICGEHRKAPLLIADICRMQAAIRRIRTAWEAIPEAMFRDAQDRAAFELAAVEGGVFRDFVVGLSSAPLRDERFSLTSEALFAAYRRLQAQPNFRAIINSWVKPFAIDQSKSKTAKAALSVELDGDVDDTDWPTDTSVHDAYTRVLRQKLGVVAQLKNRNLMSARRFAQQLVQMQLAESPAEFAAKSLCSLAQEARIRGYQTLQLEWLEEAVRICPNDGWSHGQLGDAQLTLHRFDEAAQSYRRSGENGQELFARTGHARLLRAQGRPEAALIEFEAARAAFRQNPEVHTAWVGIAETLRDLWRSDEALLVYEEALGLFAGQVSLWCGKANVLRDLGKLSEALDMYGEARNRFPTEPTPIGGYAEILKLMGEHDASLAAYDEGVSQFPDAALFACGRADTLRAARRFSAAIEAYDEARSRFSFLPAPYYGQAETYRDAGQLSQSLAVYDDAVRAFPSHPRCRNGRANVLKALARYEEALAEYDRNVRDFPYDSFALSGRASLLRQLGQYADATAAFRQIIERLPKYEYARFGLASIHVIEWHFDKAMALLPNDEPTTWESWIGRHIKGMILLRLKKNAEALELFKDCAVRTPFAAQKRLFEAGASLASLRLQQYSEAAVHARRADEIPGNVLLLHSLGAMGAHAEAASVLKSIGDGNPPIIVQLRDEIARRYKLKSHGAEKTDAWMLTMEEVALLQAA